MTGIYRHYKGTVYAVLGLCADASTNGESKKMVLYYSLAKHQLFVREISQFHENVKWPDGKMRPRFAPVDEGSGQ